MPKTIRNPQYFRLMKDGHVVGFGRIVCEFLPADGGKWTCKEIPYDEKISLSKPPIGIANIKRETFPKD